MITQNKFMIVTEYLYKNYCILLLHIIYGDIMRGMYIFQRLPQCLDELFFSGHRVDLVKKFSQFFFR